MSSFTDDGVSTPTSGSDAIRSRNSNRNGIAVVGNPLADLNGSQVVERSSSFKMLRRASNAVDQGFSNFTTGLKVGWAIECASPRFKQAVIAEFLATFIFVSFGVASAVFTSDAFIGSSSVQIPTGSSGTSIHGDITVAYAFPRILSISMMFGLMIGVLIFSTGSISGGNINPAVSIALCVVKKMSPVRCAMYVIAQCIGAVCGAGFIKSLAPKLGSAANEINWSNPFVNRWTAFGGELFCTFLLVTTVCAAGDVARERKTKYQSALTPLIIGFVVLVSHIVLIPITGCSINPARTFGTAVVSFNFNDHWIFWLAPIIGGIMAAVIYENVFKLEVVNGMPTPSFGPSTPRSFSEPVSGQLPVLNPIRILEEGGVDDVPPKRAWA